MTANLTQIIHTLRAEILEKEALHKNDPEWNEHLNYLVTKLKQLEQIRIQLQDVTDFSYE